MTSGIGVPARYEEGVNWSNGRSGVVVVGMGVVGAVAEAVVALESPGSTEPEPME